MKKIKAFTLIELLVVIAIIGILSTVVLVNLSKTKQRARDARRKSDLANMRLAIEMYYDANSSDYPGTDGQGFSNISALIAGYMSGSVVPTEPLGKSYCYYNDGNEKYAICAWMENTAVPECLPAKPSVLESANTECSANTNFGY